MYEIREKDLKGTVYMNAFHRQLSQLQQMHKELILSIGDMFKIKGKALLEEEKVVDIAYLKPLQGRGAILREEIAQVRQEQLGFQLENRDRHLFYDYLLATSLCYVEVRDLKGSGKLDAFYATKNVALAHSLVPSLSVEELKIFLVPQKTDYVHGRVRYLRLTRLKKGAYVGSKPAAALNWENMHVRIIPMYLLETTTQRVVEQLQKGYCKLTYLTKEGSKRTVISTLNPEKIKQIYDEKTVDLLKLSRLQLEKGCIRIPIMGLPTNDEGVREVSMMRLLQHTEVDASQIDRTYLHADLGRVGEVALNALAGLKQQELQFVYNALRGTAAPKQGNLRVNLEVWITTQLNTQGTRFREELHTLMINYPTLFKYKV